MSSRELIDDQNTVEEALQDELAMSGEDNQRMHEIQLARARDPDVKSRKRAGLLEVADLLPPAFDA